MTRRASTPISFRLAAGLLTLAVWMLSFHVTVRAIAPASPAPEATPSAEEQRMIDILKSLRPQKGKIILKDGIANLDIPEEFRFLDAADSRKVLVDLWRNPPDSANGTLGMLIPAHFYSDDEHMWAADISFSDAGYIKDEEPDYAQLLKQIQERQEQEYNPEREKAGYKPLHIVGWAQAPHYEKDAKKLYWAKELQSGDNPQHTLNYDIRILGRRGALEVSVIAGMDQLAQINNAAPQILSVVNFNQGHRYADFNPKTDKVAPFALAGLIGGGLVLTKLGFFAKFFALLGGAWKLVAGGLVVVGAWFKRLFGGGTKVNTDRPGPPTGTV